MLKIDEVVEWLNNNKSDIYINDAYDRANKLISAENKDNSNTFI